MADPSWSQSINQSINLYFRHWTHRTIKKHKSKQTLSLRSILLRFFRDLLFRRRTEMCKCASYKKRECRISDDDESLSCCFRTRDPKYTRRFRTTATAAAAFAAAAAGGQWYNCKVTDGTGTDDISVAKSVLDNKSITRSSSRRHLQFVGAARISDRRVVHNRELWIIMFHISKSHYQMGHPEH